MNKLNNVFIIALLFISFNLTAQNWSEDPAKRAQEEEKLVYMGDLVAQGDYIKAKPLFDWLYENNPSLTKTIYIRGSKIYESLESKEKDAAKKIELQNMALKIYDERIKYFGEEENVLNRKGLLAYNYLYSRTTENDMLYDLYKKIFELNGDDTYSTNLFYYQKMLCYKKNKNLLTDDQVMEVYEKITASIDKGVASGDKAAAQYKDYIDQTFASCVKIDCEYINSKIVPKFEAEPTNLALAKKVVSLISSQKCDQNNAYFKAAALVVQKEPSCGGAMTVARHADRSNKYDLALDFFNKALDLCGGANNAEIYYEMAEIYLKKGSKEDARTYARKSIQAGDSHKSQAYILIGNLYFKYAKDCDPQSVVLFRSRYIAAYDQYKLAGSTSNMEKAQAQFPSMDDLFTENYKIGDSFNTGCWINENIQLQKR